MTSFPSRTFLNSSYPHFETVQSRVFIAPATCGELVQGTLDGQDFIVNFPINFYAKVVVNRDPRLAKGIREARRYAKVGQAITRLVEKKGRSLADVSLEVISHLPRGKGLASSTTEISVALEAVNRTLDLSVSPQELNSLQATVVASDGILLPGISLCNSITGYCYDSFVAAENLGAIIVDSGGTVDTEDIDREAYRAHSRQFEQELRTALALVTSGLVAGDIQKIGAGASLSATIHQRLLPKSQFRVLQDATRGHGAVGINCAHSGTALGVLFDTKFTRKDDLQKIIEMEMGSESIIGTFHMVTGGVHEL